jgi:hypothetical protein
VKRQFVIIATTNARGISEGHDGRAAILWWSGCSLGLVQITRLTFPAIGTMVRPVRKNDGGTISFITIDPTLSFFEVCRRRPRREAPADHARCAARIRLGGAGADRKH